MAYKNTPEYPPEPLPKDVPDHGMETYKHDAKITEEPEKPPRDSKMGQDAANSLRDTGDGETPKPS
ncbi:MAG: hypothetical protein U9O54_02245 [Chloroflexota bacterium]|nr:hypothetical protein [Chloroflexota bacterium]